MNVLAYDLRLNEQAARSLGFRYVGMDELLKESDIISLHVPLLPSTYHLLAKPQFDQMKDGVVLINTARGDLIDEEALVRAIAERKVAAAGLDVLAKEPVIRRVRVDRRQENENAFRHFRVVRHFSGSG